MNATELRTKDGTKHPCGDGCRQRDTAEREGYAGAPTEAKMTENNATNTLTCTGGLLERIMSRGNLNQAYKQVKRN